jgi:hypothetical protein
MPQAQLRQKNINRARLHSPLPQFGSQVRVMNVISSFRDDKRKCRKGLDDAPPGLGTVESLEQFLKNQPGGEDAISSLQGELQPMDFPTIRGRVASKRQRPDTGIHQDIQRDLSFL